MGSNSGSSAASLFPPNPNPNPKPFPESAPAYSPELCQVDYLIVFHLFLCTHFRILMWILYHIYICKICCSCLLFRSSQWRPYLTLFHIICKAVVSSLKSWKPSLILQVYYIFKLTLVFSEIVEKYYFCLCMYLSIDYSQCNKGISTSALPHNLNVGFCPNLFWLESLAEIIKVY